MKLIGSTAEKQKNPNKNNENVPPIETTEVVLLDSSIANDQYHHDLRLLSIFVLSNSFVQIVNTSIINDIFIETTYSEFLCNTS